MYVSMPDNNISIVLGYIHTDKYISDTDTVIIQREIRIVRPLVLPLNRIIIPEAPEIRWMYMLH